MAGEPTTPLRLGVPAYGYPGETDLWDVLTSAPVGTVVIVDPDDGPGIAADPVYCRTVAAARRGGNVLYGYVDTAYGQRSAPDMLADVGRHVEWYGVAGVFLDQTPATFDPAIGAVIRQLRAAHLEVAINPGQPLVDPEWVRLADHVVTFEGDVAAYARTRAPAWAADFPLEKYWHLIYGVPDATTARRVIACAAARRAGMVYVTDGGMPNPWRYLPPYWADEVAALAAPAQPRSRGVSPAERRMANRRRIGVC